LALAIAPVLLAAPLDENPSYQAGLRALQDALPAIAAKRFEEALEGLSPDDPARAAVRLRIAEARVRAGQPSAAFEHLQDPALADSESAQLWVAYAFLALGRFGDASIAFAPLEDSKDRDLRETAMLSRAHLCAILAETEEALALLDSLGKSSDAAMAGRARLLAGALLTDLGRTEAANAVLEGFDPSLPSQEKRLTYLRARLAAASGDLEQSASLFGGLVGDPAHLNMPLLQASLMGRADALHALQRNDEAVETLFKLIENHPDTPLLDGALSRLASWTAERDALRELLSSRLQSWSTPAASGNFPELSAIGDPVAEAATGDTPRVAPGNLGAHATYYRARLLADRNDPASVAAALQVLARLRLELPNHRLSHRSLLETGRLQQAQGRPAEALAALLALPQMSASPGLKATAARLAGRIAFDAENFEEAAEAFASARRNLEDDPSDLTAINEALCHLQAGNDDHFERLVASLGNDGAKNSLELERALLLAYRKDPSARDALDRFLRSNLTHPRLAEARLALAEISVSTDPLDVEMARAQLDSIDAATLTDELALRHLLTAFKLAQATGEWDGAIADANRYLQQRKTPQDSGVLLKLGEAYLANGDANQARIHFLQLAAKEPEGRLHEVAVFLAANSALKVHTPEANAEAVELLEEIVSGNGILAAEARLQLARAFLDTARSEEALGRLTPLLTSSASDPVGIDALLLAAEAHRSIGTDEGLENALATYDQVLGREGVSYATSNRVHFLKGLALEQLGRVEAAVDTYYDVVDRKNRPPDDTSTEWKYYYDCGFKCLRLLEDDAPNAALRMARKLRDAGGPRSGEAGRRADQIQLKHMLWED
jgi:thioredoxin-like negative regulator of GroEL